MKRKPISEKFWPALSIALLFSFLNLSLYIILSFKPDFPLYTFIVILNIFLTAVFLFLDFSGLREKFWNIWKSWPKIIHKIICGMCAFWICFLSLKALIPAIKKDYEKN